MHRDIEMIVGDNIRINRERKHLTQTQLADLANMNRNYLSDVERGTRNITLRNVGKICDALKIQPKNIFLGVVSKHEDEPCDN